MGVTPERGGLSAETIVTLKLRHAFMTVEQADRWARDREGAAETTRFTDLLSSGSDVDFAAHDIPYLGAVAWIESHGSADEAIKSHSYRKVVGVAADWAAWCLAETELRRALLAGKIAATATRVGTVERIAIEPLEWLNLRLQRSGSADVLTNSSVYKSLYADVYVPSKVLKRLWPAESNATQRARLTRAAETACRRALISMMRQAPDKPIPKSKLRNNFPSVSERAFNRIFKEAAQEAGAEAWTHPGRRPRRSNAIDAALITASNQQR